VQIENKFNAFKQYAERYGLHWGFVRDMDGLLYIDNTEFVMDMNDDRWQPIEEGFAGLPPQPKPKQLNLFD
jgi:type III restriction enzyme